MDSLVLLVLLGRVQIAVWSLSVHISTLPSYIFNLNMPPVLSTIKIVSAPQQRHAPGHKAPPIPSHQHKEKLAVHQETQWEIDDAVAEWYQYTLAKADDLGKRFNKKPCYFLDIFFQGGAQIGIGTGHTVGKISHTTPAPVQTTPI